MLQILAQIILVVVTVWLLYWVVKLELKRGREGR